MFRAILTKGISDREIMIPKGHSVYVEQIQNTEFWKVAKELWISDDKMSLSIKCKSDCFTLI